MTHSSETIAAPEILSRAQGCLLGQFAGEMLGMPVEVMSAEDIRRLYPDGLTTISDGQTVLLPLGIHHPQPALAQLTDDGEMAMMLARSLAEQGRFDADAVREAYMVWWNDRPHLALAPLHRAPWNTAFLTHTLKPTARSCGLAPWVFSASTTTRRR